MLRYEKKNEYSISLELWTLQQKLQDDAVAAQVYYNAFSEGRYPEKAFIEHAIKSKPEKEEEFLATLFTMDFFGDDEPNNYQWSTILNSLSKLDVNKFKNNPYLKDIDLSNINIQNNDIHFTNLSFKPYELQQVGTVIRDNKFKTISPVGYFNEEVSFPSLFQDGSVWMSITPSEINTMQHHLAVMKGKVITFGLGLGYFAYMSALKDDVESVTIVEVNQDIIDIFNQYILPQFKESAREKINVIKADACDLFLDKEFMNNYNFCFIDIWKNRYDGIPLYCFFKENEKKLKCKTRYWIEEDFISVYQEALYFYILNNLKFLGIQNDAVKNKDTAYAVFYKKIENYFKSKKYVIKDKSDIYKLIFDKQIMNKIIQASVEA